MRVHALLCTMVTLGIMTAAPLPRPRPVAIYLPLPPQMEAAIREHERWMEQRAKDEEQRVAEVMREEFDDGTVVRTPPYVRRQHLIDAIKRYQIYLDPIYGPKDF
jgi:hypothetical protein